MNETINFYNSIIRGMKNNIRYSTNNRIFFKESIADHIFALSALVRLYSTKHDLDLDVNQSINIAFTHDLGEFLEGDVCAASVVHGDISLDEKDEMEHKAWTQIKQGLIGNELYDYWKEYNSQETIEAKYVKTCDKLEALLHMTSMDSNKGFRPKKFWRRHGLIEKDYDSIVKYADKYMKVFVESNVKGNIQGFRNELGSIKLILKKIFKELNIIWKEEYNYAINPD